MIFLYRYDVPALVAGRVRGLAAVGDRFDLRRVVAGMIAMIAAAPRCAGRVAPRAAPAGAGRRTRPQCLPADAAARAGRRRSVSRRPTPKATELNSAGKTSTATANGRKRASSTAPPRPPIPTFLAPRLNVACSFVRQERFAEATAEVEALLARAYVPWAREVLEAADLGALKPRPEMARIRRAMTRGGRGLGRASSTTRVLFVGRARAPLRIPAHGRRRSSS